MDKLQELEKSLGKQLKYNVKLADFTSIKIGGSAKYFYQANTIDDLIKAVLLAQKAKINYLVLGAGSNLIFSDRGYDGLIIINKTHSILFIPDKAQVIVDSGVMLARLIMQAAEHNLGGIEALFGIPATIGGAVYGNAGAHKIEIGQFVKSITLLDVNGKIIRCRSSWLRTSYRMTHIKKIKKENLICPIILSIKFQLMPKKKEEIVKKIQYYQNLRQEKQPYDKPTCGSVFKNPGSNANQSAGYLIEKCGLKGKKIGKMQISPKHANFIQNLGGGTANEFCQIVELIKQTVFEKEKIKLQEEIEYMR